MGKIIASNLFWYDVPFFNLLAGQSQSYTLQTQTDSIFEVQRLMSAVSCSMVDVLTDIGLGAVLEGQHFAGIEVFITELNSGEKWSDAPVSLTNLFGTGQTPLVIPQTVIWEKNSSIQFDITNNSGTDFPQLYLTFFGRKLFD